MLLLRSLGESVEQDEVDVEAERVETALEEEEEEVIWQSRINEAGERRMKLKKMREKT
jgi:hypothetical protein